VARGQHKDKYSMLKAAGKLHGSITEARAKCKVRDRRHTQNFLTFLDTPSRIIIPLGPIQQLAMLNVARRMKPRLRRWDTPTPTSDVMLNGISIAEVGQYRHGRRLTSAPVEYQPRTRSFAVVTRKRLCWYISTQHAIWIAPKGWHFGTDCRPGTSNLRVYACRDSFPNDLEFRWYFDSDAVYRGETEFWKLARQHVKSVQRERQDKREYARITSTVITVELIVPHNGVRTIIRVQRTGPMRMRYARDFVS